MSARLPCTFATSSVGERCKRTGEILPDSALEEFKKFDSIFLGAISHPDVKPGILEVGILLKTHFALDQWINRGNINPEGVSMFEPMGGSAPKYTARMSSTRWPPSAPAA